MVCCAPNVDVRKFLSMTMVLVNVKAADLWLITEGRQNFVRKMLVQLHVDSSTRASESPNEAYEFVPDGLTFGDYPGPINGVGTRIILWGAE